MRLRHVNGMRLRHGHGMRLRHGHGMRGLGRGTRGVGIGHGQDAGRGMSNRRDTDDWIAPPSAELRRQVTVMQHVPLGFGTDGSCGPFLLHKGKGAGGDKGGVQWRRPEGT